MNQEQGKEIPFYFLPLLKLCIFRPRCIFALSCPQYMCPKILIDFFPPSRFSRNKKKHFLYTCVLCIGLCISAGGDMSVCVRGGGIIYCIIFLHTHAMVNWPSRAGAIFRDRFLTSLYAKNGLPCS